MARKFIIPSVFTVIDQLSPGVKKMASNTEASMSRMERSMRKVSTAAFDVSKKAAMVGAAILVPLALVANEAVKFEASMSNVSTLIDTNVESIDAMGDSVLDLSKKLPVPIEELTEALFDVRSAGVSAEDQFIVLESSAQLASAGLATVKEATDVTTSAMNSFAKEGLSVNEINNILFKTTKFGKTTIAELSQAFGSVAATVESSGTSLMDFSAATSAITTTGTPAAQAQNQIRASIIALQKPTAEMTSVFEKLGVTTDKELIQKFGGLVGGFEAVNEKVEEMGLNAAKTWSSTNALAAVTSLTGAQNEAYTTTLEAMASGTDDLSIAFEKQSSTGKAQMQIMKNNVQALGISLGKVLLPLISDIVKAVVPVIEKFAAWAKANKSTVAIILKVAAVAAGLAFAISGVAFVVGIAAKAMAIFSGVQKAWAVATKIVTAAQWLWNAAVTANPVGAVIVAVLALAAGVYLLSRAFDTSTSSEKLNAEVRSRALENTIDQRVEVTMLFMALRKAEVGSTRYNDTLKELERIQPGIIDQYNLQAGALADINAAEKELIGNIMKRAEAEAKAELMKEKIKASLTAEAEGPGFFDKALEFSKRSVLAATTLGLSEITGAQSFVIDSAEEKNQQNVADLMSDANLLAEEIATDELSSASGTELVNPEKTKSDIINSTVEKTTKEKVLIEFANAPEGMSVSGGANVTGNLSMPNMGSTK